MSFTLKHVMFVSDWDYALFWEKVATMMKQQGLITKASSYMVGRIYYDKLIKKNDNAFDVMYLMQDHLEEVPEGIDNEVEVITALQNKYIDDPLWRFVWADRTWVNNSYVENIRRLIKCFSYFEQLLDYEKPDLILANAYGSMPHLILYAVAKHRGIKIIRPISNRMGSGYFISDNDIENEEWISEELTTPNKIPIHFKKKSRNYINQMRKKISPPAYELMKTNLHKIRIGHVYRFFQYFFNFYFTDKFKNDHTKKSPFRRVLIEIIWRIKRRLLLNKKHWSHFNFEKRKFVYFPLHVQPEMSTMTYAPFYLRQVSIIENVAKSLPVEYQLLVKEHPSMLGRRSQDYYNQIKKITNVELVYPFLDSTKIIKEASLIVTITGTVGLEGLIVGKPVISFGSVYFTKCPLIYDCRNLAPTLWRHKIKDVLENYKCNEEILENFIAVVLSRSFKGNYMEPLMNYELIMSENNLQMLIDKICNYCQR